ncbi:MAG: hypothetical protein LBF97_06070 [Elusimicrobiota bacterium]|jgi:hypothetical protein|nr:hypothetical protein [Elusimicrobiota bacterium]
MNLTYLIRDLNQLAAKYDIETINKYVKKLIINDGFETTRQNFQILKPNFNDLFKFLFDFRELQIKYEFEKLTIEEIVQEVRNQIKKELEEMESYLISRYRTPMN